MEPLPILRINRDGRTAEFIERGRECRRRATCADWTSSSTSSAAQVGHSDGLGPNQSIAGTFSSWNAAHTSQDCSNTAPLGGAGRIYCFVR